MKRIIAILIGLTLILLIAVYINTQNQNNNAGLTIKYEEIEKNISDLSNYESTRITTKKGKDYLAFPLTKMINSIGIKEVQFSKITFHSSDGGTLAVNGNELANLYLVENKKGKEQYLRLVIPTDDFSQRWLKYIVMIELSND